ncbi:thioesterase family protein [Alphaproteobacteria bacterium KMM 3653]|uniref:Thioesterase family protein n=1 Tax=Harenicola maris TaxID=2841044 RepID=A0AAP2CNZ0_9RHOB|nr:thioesterase family protein [Harenicola maris]
MLELYETHVPAEWIDEFGHMNLAHYVTLCDQATYAFWNRVNAPKVLEEREGHEYAVLESHICYLDELAEGEFARVTTQLLEADAKRFILFHRVLKADGTLAATNEIKTLGFNLETRRAESFLPHVAKAIEADLAAQASLPRPDSAGQGIALSRKR